MEDIARSDAGVVNLSKTTKILQDIVEQSHRNRRKSICFVTGVPGAGKTLVGLNIATMTTDAIPTVFLSGNGPLVEVLREALARDQHSRGMATSKEAAKRRVNTFIQNIHHFRDEALRTTEPPHERVAIFDEAQRAWDAKHTAKFMVGKRNQLEWQLSEPEFLIQIMDRHADWCVVIALVGSGQEINSGEAGLRGWVEAIEARYTGWDVYFSQQLRDVEYEQAASLFDQLPNSIVESVPDLHLATSMRSFRAERLSQFVHLLLQDDAVGAYEVLEGIGPQYPILVTQNIELAKEWVNRRVRGSERSGMLASSSAIRLKPHGINVKSKVDAAVWFLNEPSDIRSSTFLEDAATEFDVQGLELDWGLVAWDGDLRHNGKSFEYWDFRGTAWQHTSRWQFLQNAYRVLLTRFRQGFVIFVPEGDVTDPTRDPIFYDKTFEYLRRCGIPELRSSDH